jgi:hypothetical protein
MVEDKITFTVDVEEEKMEIFRRIIWGLFDEYLTNTSTSARSETAK